MSFGNNAYGQLGLGNNVKQSIPNQISFSQPGIQLNRTKFSLSESSFIITYGTTIESTTIESKTIESTTIESTTIESTTIESTTREQIIKINSNNSSNIGLIIGLVIGIFILVISFIIIVFLIIRIRKNI